MSTEKAAKRRTRQSAQRELRSEEAVLDVFPDSTAERRSRAAQMYYFEDDDEPGST